MLADAQEEYERLRQKDRVLVDEDQRTKILALATDIPKIWADPQTPARERKRMVRLLLEDVTLIKGDDITLHVRFKGGATQTLTRPRPPTAWQMRKTSTKVVAEIDRLLDDHTEAEIATLLNERGYRSGADRDFTPLIVGNIRRSYELKSRYDRLRERGLLTLEEMADLLDVCTSTVKRWKRYGLLRAHPYNDKYQFLFEHPGDALPIKSHGIKLSDERRFASNRVMEVQCET